MPRSVLVAVLVMTAVVGSACGQRHVEVQNGPKPATELTLHVVNNLSQAVNVYVVSSGSDLFLKQVGANGSESISVPGIASGATVMLKATAADGSRTYTRDNVTLSGTYEWQVP